MGKGISEILQDAGPCAYETSIYFWHLFKTLAFAT